MVSFDDYAKIVGFFPDKTSHRKSKKGNLKAHQIQGTCKRSTSYLLLRWLQFGTKSRRQVFIKEAKREECDSAGWYFPSLSFEWGTLTFSLWLWGGKTAITKSGTHALMVQLSAVVRCLVFEASNANLTIAKLPKCSVKNIMSCNQQRWVVWRNYTLKLC